MTDTVLAEVDRGVLTLTLNRPDRLNAWVPEMESRFFELLDEGADDPAVRVIVVTGAGRGFCPGADMDYLGDLSEGQASLRQAAADRPRRSIVHAMSVPKPVIGSVNGACAGLGLALAMSFDLRFATPEAKFTTAFARRGLIAEHGLSWTLPMTCGMAVANDLLLSGRVFTGEEALRLGVVNRLVEGGALVDETRAYARDMAVNCSPASLAAMKRQVQRATGMDVHTAVREANHLMAQTIAGPDFKEGVASYVGKREPAFPPLGSGTELTWPDGSAGA